MSSDSRYLLDPKFTNPARLKREREKARELKKSNWWKAKIASGECQYCLKFVGTDQLTMDHIVPLARGGESVRANVAPCCKDCNSKKKLQTPVEQIFAQLEAEKQERLQKEQREKVVANPESDDFEDEADNLGNRWTDSQEQIVPGAQSTLTQSKDSAVGLSLWGAGETQFFFSLSPEKVLKAVESTGIICTGRCFALNSFENRVYDVELDLERSAARAGQSPEALEVSRGRVQANRKVIKFYRPGRWSEAQILEEHRFLMDLQHAEIPVIAPELFPDGTTLRQNPDGIWFSIFPKFGGRAPDELDDEQLRQVGRLLARIHLVGASREAPHRVALTSEAYGRSNLSFLVAERCLPRELEADYIQCVEEICRRVDDLFKNNSGIKIQRVHGDCHKGNLLWTPQGAAFLDFDDMVRGPVIQDIWMVCPGRDAQALADREILLEGYEQMRAFDRRELKLVEGLRALRMIHYAAWIARRWSDPAFPRAFPHFGTLQYWSDELSALREQVAAIEA